ncbi:MAG TPA: hypothetical protein VD833_07445 [Vicinamibacterales bacterium]|nr:hypothetical protein [Vicinamibacterales bacterium]
MLRRSVTTTCALLLALAPASIFAQDPPAQQPPAQPPAQQPPAEAQPQPPTAPKLAFDSNAGLLLVQIKPGETAAFEELVAKLRAGLQKSTDAELKQQMSGWKVYKSSEPMGANALYVVMVDPAVPKSEYDFFGLLQKVMTPEELRDPATQEMFKRFVNAFAAGYNKLNLTPLAGGGM